MFRFYRYSVILSILFFFHLNSQEKQFDVTFFDKEDFSYVENQVIIKFREGTHLQTVNEIKENLNAVVKEEYTFIHAELWEIDGITVRDAVIQYIDHDAVEFIDPLVYVDFPEPESISLDFSSFDLMSTHPDDPLFHLQWHLENTGQSGGTAGADIDATAAWLIETGSPVRIGVMDSGIDYEHVDLADNMWENIGWNFVNNNNNPMDFGGHGTMVAGVLAATTNNGTGVAGVTWEAELVALRTEHTGHITSAMYYMINNNVQISNHSYSVGVFIQSMFNAFQAARDAGHLAVAAAGNGSMNINNAAIYPARFNLENIITVAASNHNDTRASYSNWGNNSVHLAAPGGDGTTCYNGLILTTDLSNQYTCALGTSFAAPVVAGAAAVVWSHYPDWTYQQVKDRLMESVDQSAHWQNLVISGGRLNLNKALQDPNTDAPDAITDLTVTDEFYNTVTLSWTAPGESADTGRAYKYDIRYSTDPITDGNFGQANQVSDTPVPQQAGETEVFDVTGLNTETTYYFAVKTTDAWMNWSDISNVVTATTEGEPQLAVEPASLSVELEIGETTTEIITLNNEGDGKLVYEFLTATPSVTPYGEFRNYFVAGRNPAERSGEINPNFPGAISMELSRASVSANDGGNELQYEVLDSIYYDSGGRPVAAHVGFGNINIPIYTATRFTVEGDSFFLTHIRNAYQTQNAVPTVPVTVEIYKGGKQPDEGILLTEQEFHGVARTGEFFLIELNDPQWFVEGEEFWIILKYQPGMTHSQGIDRDIHEAGNRFWYSSPNLNQWRNITLDIPGAAYKVRALQLYQPWVMLDPVAGIVDMNAQQEIELFFDATVVHAGTFSSTVLLQSNAPGNPWVSIPVDLEIGNLDLPEQVTLAYPPDSETIIVHPDTIMLPMGWHSSEPDILFYELEIASDQSFDNTVVFRFPTVPDTQYVYRELQDDRQYWWRVRAMNQSGWGDFSDAWTFNSLVVGVDPITHDTPAQYVLSQNYPNPFNPSTVIKFGLPERSSVKLEIFNTLGQRVATLIDDVREAGYHDIEWYSGRVASGVYFYRIEAVSTDSPASRFVQVRSMVLVK